MLALTACLSDGLLDCGHEDHVGVSQNRAPENPGDTWAFTGNVGVPSEGFLGGSLEKLPRRKSEGSFTNYQKLSDELKSKPPVPPPPPQ